MGARQQSFTSLWGTHREEASRDPVDSDCKNDVVEALGVLDTRVEAANAVAVSSHDTHLSQPRGQTDTLDVFSNTRAIWAPRHRLQVPALERIDV